MRRSGGGWGGGGGWERPKRLSSICSPGQSRMECHRNWRSEIEGNEKSRTSLFLIQIIPCFYFCFFSEFPSLRLSPRRWSSARDSNVNQMQLIKFRRFSKVWHAKLSLINKWADCVDAQWTRKRPSSPVRLIHDHDHVSDRIGGVKGGTRKLQEFQSKLVLTLGKLNRCRYQPR